MLGRRNLGLLAVTSALGFAFAVGCSGSTKSSPSKKDGGGSTTDKTCAQTKCNLPPTDPGTPQANGTTPTVLAISKLYLGDVNAQGQPDPNAWKTLGYNLDNLVSTPGAKNHCTPQAGANVADVETDGVGGIDNSFGENLMPLIASLASDPDASVNSSISNGSFTVMVKMDNVDSQATQSGVNAALYGGANLGSPPKWDGTDQWPVVPELLGGNPPSENDPLVTFPKSFVVNNTWVSGSQGKLSLSLSVQGYSLTLDIVKAVITMNLSPDRKSATGGIIAGVINTDSLVSELRKIAGSFDKSLCSGSTFDSIAQQIKAASDIMDDGSNGDPSKTCNAISIGLGFDAKAVQLGPVAPAAKPTADPCADAGTGTDSGTGGSGAGGAGAGGADAGI